MKIGVISDTHIPTDAVEIPREVLDDLKSADMVIVAGDLVAPEVLNTLRRVCRDVRGVWGNMDEFEVRRILPEKDIIEVGKFRIGVIHGYGHPNGLVNFVTQAFKDKEVDMIIFGHSHTPLNEKKGRILYFNPGSPTDKRFAPYNSYGMVEINDNIEARIIKL